MNLVAKVKNLVTIGQMNKLVFENSMFTDDKSYVISICMWVCIQNATTDCKQVP